jgi:hypothetical protein
MRTRYKKVEQNLDQCGDHVKGHRSKARATDGLLFLKNGVTLCPSAI